MTAAEVASVGRPALAGGRGRTSRRGRPAASQRAVRAIVCAHVVGAKLARVRPN
jgi:hypothetical protein